MNYQKYLKISILFIILLSNCAKKDPIEEQTYEPDLKKRLEKARDAGGGIFGDINKDKKTNTFDFATANPLWRATLKVLEFLPLQNIDYSGGVIIYDWYSTDLDSNEQIKVTVRFTNTELRGDSLKIISYKKICKTDMSCSTKSINDNFNSEIKDQIIQEARRLKIEEEKAKKN
jgi:hypothetical protein